MSLSGVVGKNVGQERAFPQLKLGDFGQLEQEQGSLRFLVTSSARFVKKAHLIVTYTPSNNRCEAMEKEKERNASTSC